MRKQVPKLKGMRKDIPEYHWEMCNAYECFRDEAIQNAEAAHVDAWQEAEYHFPLKGKSKFAWAKYNKGLKRAVKFIKLAEFYCKQADIHAKKAEELEKMLSKKLKMLSKKLGRKYRVKLVA